MRIYQKCQIVAEIGCNHGGNLCIAKEMIKSAKNCGADYVKFQKRNPELAVPKHMQTKPHPCPQHAYGETYLEHRKLLEFNIDQHRCLKQFCEEIGIKYACSVWDVISAEEIISLQPDYIKVPSAMNGNYKLLNTVYNKYNKDIHISLGMTTKYELEKLFKFVEKNIDRTVFYWTTSGYPVSFDELFLLEIDDLKKRFPRIGYSGHHLGLAIDVVAITLGCEWIERHFTLNRTWKGTDNAASLEPPGLQKLCRDIKAAQRALSYKYVDLTDDEKKNREKLRIDD